MASSSGVPLALKVFFFSLLAGVGGGYGAFKLGVFLALKYWEGEHAQAIAMAIGAASTLVVGVCSAVTAGVLAGRVTRA